MPPFLHASALLLLTLAVQAQTPIDFSTAGYGGGKIPIPAVPATRSVRPSGNDDTLLLNWALDRGGSTVLQPGR